MLNRKEASEEHKKILQAEIRAQMEADASQKMLILEDRIQKVAATASDGRKNHRQQTKRLMAQLAHSENEKKRLRREASIKDGDNKTRKEEDRITKDREVTAERRKIRQELQEVHDEEIARLMHLVEAGKKREEDLLRMVRMLLYFIGPQGLSLLLHLQHVCILLYTTYLLFIERGDQAMVLLCK